MQHVTSRPYLDDGNKITILQRKGGEGGGREEEVEAGMLF